MHCNHIRRLTPLTFDIDFMFVNVNYRLYVAFEIYSRWHTGIDKVPINEKWAFPCTCWLVVVQGWSIMGWQKLQKKNVKPARDEGKTVHQFPKNVIRYYIIGKNVTVCNCNCKFDYCTYLDWVEKKTKKLWTRTWGSWSPLEIDGILKTCAVYLVSEDILGLHFEEIKTVLGATHI